MTDDLKQKAMKWRTTGIAAAIVAILIAIFSAFSFSQAAKYEEAVIEQQKASDAAESAVKKPKQGALSTSRDQYAAREFGGWDVEVRRGGVVIDSEYVVNFLADEGEADLLNCFYRETACPVSFEWALLNTSATPVEASTWAGVSANELVVGTSPGYEAASKALARSAVGWSGFDTVASGTGGCTEAVCARVSTAAQTITASGNWSVGGRFIVVRVATSNRVIAIAQLSTDRVLSSGDQLTLTYRQAMQ